MATTTAFKNALLDSAAMGIDTLSLHNGDPGAAGTNNEISGGGYSRQSCAFDAAAGGERALSAAVDFVCTALQAVSYVGFWDGATFIGSKPLTGDAAFNASGEYQVTTATKISIADA